MVVRQAGVARSESARPPGWFIGICLAGIPAIIAVIYLGTNQGITLLSVVDHPEQAGLAFLLLGAAVAAVWLRCLARSAVDALLPVAVGLGWLALLLLGLGSLLLIEHFADLRFPIAQYEVLPSVRMVKNMLGWNAAAGASLLAGLWLGSAVYRRRGHGASEKVELDGGYMTPAAQERLGQIVLRLFLIGLAGSALVVASTHSLALFDKNVDAVRYSQGVSLGFATLAQFELVTSAALSFALALTAPERRSFGMVLAVLSVILLIVTRAERTPTLVALFASMLFLRHLGWRPNLMVLFAITAVVITGVLYLGVFRLQSQTPAGTVTSQEQEVRFLLDVSPEVREQAFVYSLFPAQITYAGANGMIPVGLAVVPGKLLAPLGVKKQDISLDSSRIYANDMNNLHIYDTQVPIRVGLAGELWMDGGPLVLVLGMIGFGFGVVCLARWRPRGILHIGAKAVMGAYCVVALITPLAVVSPLLLVTVLPLLIAGDAESRRLISDTTSPPLGSRPSAQSGTLIAR